VEELTARVRNIAEGAALMTETTLEVTFVSGAYNMLSNDVIGDHMMEVLEELGPLEFTKEEHAYARRIVDAFPPELRSQILASDKLPEDLIDQALNGDVWPIRDRGDVLPGSTDVSDVSWITPTAQITTTTWALAIPGHSWAVTATGAMSIGHKGMIHAAKVMAITAADFIADPSLLEKARTEFKTSTARRPYQCPIPEDVEPRNPLAH
jgi:aminobenzoyl-glutamate utilization protein B